MNKGRMFLVCTLAAAPLFGSAKLQICGGRPVVNGVYVNGHGPYRFLVDTGAGSNQIDASLARSIGLHPTVQVDVMTPTGMTRLPGSDGLAVELDSVKADQQEFLYVNLQVVRQLSSGI